jgi:DNA-binding PadR family transcriptional regulator
LATCGKTRFSFDKERSGLSLSKIVIMNRKRLSVDFVELHILHHASESPVYGLWMLEELGHHGYRLSPSHLYPRFHRLVRKGLLRRHPKVVEGKLRKYYILTARGRRHWEVQKRRLVELVSEALADADLRRVLEKRG